MIREAGDKTAAIDETADTALKRVASFPIFASGSKNIDNLLGGGYRAGTLTLLFGRSSSGKTQLAMQGAMICAKGGAKALFIDTEGSFRPERVEQMSTARGWNPDKILNGIVYVRSDSASEQMGMIRRMGSRSVTASCRLVVVDTLTRNLSVELPGRTNIASRQAALNVLLSEAARDAYLNGRAYLLTNRVTFGTQEDVGIGGRTVNQLVHASVLLAREGNKVKATLVGSGTSVTAEMGRTGVD